MKTKLINLIDFDKVNILLEGFNKSTGFVTAILDLRGNVLSKSGWRQVCTDFHRVHPETSKRCTISDTVLAGKMEEGEKFHYYKCLNGLVDVAVPIVIKGIHIANLFTGQFFFEEPDRAYFAEQARKFGFDEASYFESLEKVPVIPIEKVRDVMEFLLNMTLMISEMTFQKLEQMELNTALQESEGRYRSFVTASSDSVYRMSPDWKIMYTLDGRGFIADTEKPNANWFQEYIPPTDQEQVMAVIQQAIRTKSIFELEHHVWRVDGAIGWTFSRAIPRLDAHGEIFEWFGAASDISERKQAEKALQQAKEYAENLIATANVMIVGLDATGKINVFNETAERITGYTRADLAGKNWFEILVPRNKYPQVWAEFERLLQGGFPRTFENPILSKTGEERQISWQNNELREDGQICGTISFGIDITDQKRAEVKLQEQLDELTRWQKVTLGREERVQKLKDEVNELLALLNKTARYK
ncbi:MAG: PocR ligand-binding domain-containing protein [Bacteroidales bacterium]|nr:PocR ligand-binding domain-containing protein [Bacteroidales bacterium]